MTKRMLNVVKVQITARATEGLFDRLESSACVANVPWDVARDVIKRKLLHPLNMAAWAMLSEIATWSPDDWAEQDEVKQAHLIQLSRGGYAE